MSFLKKAGKALGAVAKAGMTIPGTDVNPSQALFGSLAHHLGAENKQHAQHMHVHHHNKKK